MDLNNTNKKLIVTDLDGTLLRSRGHISDYTVDVVKRCRKNGHLFCFATARPRRTTFDFCNRLEVDGVIVNNGASVYVGSDLVYERVIPSETSCKLLEFFHSHEKITSFAFETGDFLETNSKELLERGGSWNAVYSDFSDISEKHVYKIGIACENVDIVKEIISVFPELCVNEIEGENWHLITHRNASKINGVRILADKFGIQINDVIAFGDDHNDAGMIEEAGKGVAVENAVSEIIQLADEITGDNNSDGVASYLEKNLLNKIAENTGKIKVKVRDLHKSFGHKKILCGINIDIYEGEILCIIGPSGTGKSVILKNIVGLLDPDIGEISVDGHVYYGEGIQRNDKIRKQFGVLFQGAALFDSMNIYDNVAFGMRRLNVDENLIAENIPVLLESVGLKGVEFRMPSELSGGMQKRVALARSIAMHPEIMMYDEPTTGVDPITAAAVDRLIVDMNRKYGITSVVITHDLDSACRIASRIIMLRDGKVYFTGSSYDLKNSDDAYICQFMEGRAS